MFRGFNNISSEMQEQLLELSKLIFKEFGSLKKYIQYFENIKSEDLIYCNSEGEDFLQKYKFYLLITPRSTDKFPKGTSFFRIMKQSSSWYEEFQQLYSNPNPLWDMRFNCKGERMLYVTTCRNVGIKEAKVSKGIFTEIEYTG